MERMLGFHGFLLHTRLPLAQRFLEAVSMEKPKQHARDERERIKRKEDEVTVDSDESFPASDPSSFNPGTTGAPQTKKQKK